MKNYVTTFLISIFIFIPAKVLGETGITIDSSLQTSVTQKNVNFFEVNNGTTIGSSLLHSFKNLNLTDKQSLFFNNDALIKNIFVRVTGVNSSIIDGFVGSNGGSSLFLLNPNGVLFGKSFKLKIGGSFFTSTASSILLNNNFLFNTKEEPLNINNVPSIANNITNVKFILDQTSGKINISGNGLQLMPLPGLGQLLAPTGNAGKSETGFLVGQGQMIGLIGNGIELDKGVLIAPSGRIYVASASNGEIELSSVNNQWKDLTVNSSSFSNINLQNLSLLDVSGTTEGSIKLFGHNISIKDGSFILSQSLIGSNSGELDITAKNNLSITGASENPVAYDFLQVSNFAGIVSQTLYGDGTNINIKAKDVLMNNGGQTSSIILIKGRGGDINVEADTLTLDGYSKYTPISNPTAILASNLNSGRTGDINIHVGDLKLSNGASASNSTLNLADSGNITLTSERSTTISGYNPYSNISSQSTTSTIGSGKAGNLKVFTPVLSLSENGFLGSRIIGNGSTGNVEVNAGDIYIYGGKLNNLSLTGIYSAAVAPDPLLATILGIPITPNGNVNDLTVRAKNIKLYENGLISVQNDGKGNGGKLDILAKNIILFNSSITASTKGGNGGNIDIITQLLLQKNGVISSSATLSGNGGNTTIAANGIAGDYQSAITANADQGFGGNIDINTLALVFPLSNITASSQRGIAFNGSVNVKSVGFTRIDQAAKHPVILGKSLPEICNSSINERSFLITAADIPENIDDLRETDSPLSKVPYSIDNKTGKKILDIGMQGWYLRPDGKGEPIAFNNLAFGGSYLINACKELFKNHALKN